MPLIVLSSDVRMRTSLCAIACGEGLPAEPAGSIREVGARWDGPGLRVVLVDAVRDATIARAFVPLADAAGIPVGLMCTDETVALAQYPCVRHVLATPFTTAALRIFLADLVRSGRPGSHIRLKAAIAGNHEHRTRRVPSVG